MDKCYTKKCGFNYDNDKMKELKVFMGKVIHPNFTKEDDDLYYLKKEVDEIIKELETKENVCYKKWLILNTENEHLKENIKEIKNKNWTITKKVKK